MRMLLLILFFICGPAMAASLPSDRLPDPALEARAENLFGQLRCLVCQNETIAESDARIAHDLRLMVRTRLKGGDSDAQIMDFIHSRYGDFVLLKPPLRASTFALWFGPLAVLLAGLAVVIGIVRRQGAAS